MMACFRLSISESTTDEASVEAKELEEESENQLDFFLLLLLELADEPGVDGDGEPDALEEASLCRCCSRIWSSPIAK